MEEHFINWLLKEIPELESKHIISAETAAALAAYYNKKLEALKKPSTQNSTQTQQIAETKIAAQTTPVSTSVSKPVSQTFGTSQIAAQQTSNLKPLVQSKSKSIPKLSVSVILTIIAGVLISFGIFSLIAYNWAAIPRTAKLITAIFMMLAAQCGGFLLVKTKKAEKIKVRESYSLFWALLFGGLFQFILQICKFSVDSHIFLLVWTISSILITFLFAAHTTFYLSMLFSLLFVIFSWTKLSFIWIYPICVSLFFLAKKSQAKTIPLVILSALLYLLRINQTQIPDNLQNMIFTFAASSIALTQINKKNQLQKYIGAGVLGLISFFTILGINLFNNPSVKVSAQAIPEIVILSFIALAFFTQGAILPLAKKIKNKAAPELKQLLYILPLILLLNALFPEQAKILFQEKAAQWYKIFISPFTLLIFYSAILFILHSEKKSNASWLFLAFLIIQALKVCGFKECTPTLFFTIISIVIFAAGTILWKNNFEKTSEAKISLIIMRCFAALLIFGLALVSQNLPKVFFSGSRVPLAILFCYVPVLIFGLAQFVRFAKRNFGNFLLNLDILINLIFATVMIAIAPYCYENIILLIIKIFVAANFIFSSIFAIKKAEYSFLVYTATSLIYFFVSLLNPHSGTTILYMLCAISIYAAGLFIWKNNFSFNAEIKSSLIIVRVIAVLLLFITSILAINEQSALYNAAKIDTFILCCFSPTAIFGLVQFVLFAKKNKKLFWPNIDIFANIIFTALILLLAHYSNKSVILFLLEIAITINLFASFFHIIKTNKYEYLFYTIFSAIYFVVTFSGSGCTTTVLYFISTIAIFLSGLYVWKCNFKLSKTDTPILNIARIVSAILILVTTVLAQNSQSILYQNQGIERYILICFTPAAIFGLVLLANFAKKDFKTFENYLDIFVNLVFASLMFVVSRYSYESAILIACESILILNLIFSLRFVLKNNSLEYLAAIFANVIYFCVKVYLSDDTNKAANFFVLISIIVCFIHYIGQIKQIKPLKMISTITTGFILFYETSLRNYVENSSNYISFELFNTSFIVILSAAIIYHLINLLRKKIVFNLAIFITPAAILLLTCIEDKYSIIVTFPLILLFCVYYFYYAYKNDSLKIANLSTIYFGLMLMIRFFSSGYGLAIQGVTLIAMGIVLLVMNILMTKRREKNE